MSVKQYYKPSLLLNPAVERQLKQLALDRDVKVQDMIRDAVLGLLAEGTASPKLVTPSPVPTGTIGYVKNPLPSLSPSQINEMRSLLLQVVSILDGVLQNGEDTADAIGELEAELETIDSLGGDAGTDREDPPPHGVTPTKGRRAR